MNHASLPCSRAIDFYSKRGPLRSYEQPRSYRRSRWSRDDPDVSGVRRSTGTGWAISRGSGRGVRNTGVVRSRFGADRPRYDRARRGRYAAGVGAYRARYPHGTAGVLSGSSAVRTARASQDALSSPLIRRADRGSCCVVRPRPCRHATHRVESGHRCRHRRRSDRRRRPGEQIGNRRACADPRPPF